MRMCGVRPVLMNYARNGIEVERWNRFHPTDKPKVPYVTQCLKNARDRL